MRDDDEIDLSDITIGNVDLTNYSDVITVTGVDATYDSWLENYIGNIDITDDWIYNPESKLGANNISLTGGGEEMLRVAEDGFYVRGIKVKQGKREAKAVYEAFKRWMTHAIMSGELNNDK
jgi:hypothetical protein